MDSGQTETVLSHANVLLSDGWCESTRDRQEMDGVHDSGHVAYCYILLLNHSSTMHTYHNTAITTAIRTVFRLCDYVIFPDSSTFSIQDEKYSVIVLHFVLEICKTNFAHDRHMSAVRTD